MRQLGEPIVEKYITLNAVHGLVEEKEKAVEEAVKWFDRYVM